MELNNQDPQAIRVWEEFLTQINQGNLPPERIQPIDPNYREVLRNFVQTIKDSLLTELVNASPEIFRVEDKVHFLLPLGKEQRTFTLTFLTDGQDWKFHHVESFVLDFRPPLSLPRSSFSDLPADQKAWIIAEFQVTEQIRLFNFLVTEKGRDFAYQWFRDGAGYTLAARVWIPYYPPPQAFILYMCWEQANLRGSQVTLQVLEDDQALVDFKPLFFELYWRTGHLKTMVSFDDYRQMFETVWTDRARSAGWKLDFTYRNESCQMVFTR